MLSLLASLLFFGWLLSPSRAHLRSQIELEDRRQLDCRGSSMDGRRANVSAYAPENDLDLHSSDSLIVCQQKILPPGLRPLRSEDLLRNSQSFAERLLRKMQLEPRWKEKDWTVEVLIERPELQQKLSFAIKTELVQGDFRIRHRTPASEPLVGLKLDEWRESCAAASTGARLFVYLPSPKSSQLQAAACTEEGWKWL